MEIIDSESNPNRDAEKIVQLENKVKLLEKESKNSRFWTIQNVGVIFGIAVPIVTLAFFLGTLQESVRNLSKERYWSDSLEVTLKILKSLRQDYAEIGQESKQLLDSIDGLQLLMSENISKREAIIKSLRQELQTSVTTKKVELIVNETKVFDYLNIKITNLKTHRLKIKPMINYYLYNNDGVYVEEINWQFSGGADKQFWVSEQSVLDTQLATNILIEIMNIDQDKEKVVFSVQDL